MDYKEIEVRFLEINEEELVKKLIELGAEDKGEDLLEEVILFDKELIWRGSSKRLRLRTQKGKTYLSYKNHIDQTAEGTEEIEFEVSDRKAAEDFLERLGFPAFRQQQKKRHTFVLGDVIFDFDTRPRIPTYLEIESTSEEKIKEMAERIGLDYSKVIYEDPRIVLQKYYNIPIDDMRLFTFDKFE